MYSWSSSWGANNNNNNNINNINNINNTAPKKNKPIKYSRKNEYLKLAIQSYHDMNQYRFLSKDLNKTIVFAVFDKTPPKKLPRGVLLIYHLLVSKDSRAATALKKLEIE